MLGKLPLVPPSAFAKPNRIGEPVAALAVPSAAESALVDEVVLLGESEPPLELHAAAVRSTAALTTAIVMRRDECLTAFSYLLIDGIQVGDVAR
jgi:ABC-type cobalamin transport system permease subunit